MINTHDWKMIPTVKLEQKKKVSWADNAYLERRLVPEQRLEIQHYSFAEHNQAQSAAVKNAHYQKMHLFSEQSIQFSNKPFLAWPRFTVETI